MDVRCGNPDCPEQPEIEDDPNLSLEERTQCPVCGSKIRTFGISLSGSLGQQAAIQPAVEHNAAGSITAVATITADGVVEDIEPRVRLAGLDGVLVDHEVTLRWLELAEGNPNGPCMLELVDAEGVPLVTGHGETPWKAMLTLMRHMLPPGSKGHREPPG